MGLGKNFLNVHDHLTFATTSYSRDTDLDSTVQRIDSEFPHTSVTYGLLSFAVIFLIAEALKLELCRSALSPLP